MMKSKLHEEKVEKALRSSKASIEIEGFEITDDIEALVKKKMNGEITEKEYQEAMAKL